MIFKLLHLTNFVGNRSFGVGPVALNLACGQQALGHHVVIWSCDSETEARELEGQNRLQPNTIRTFPILGPRRLAYSPAMEHAIVRCADEFDVVHMLLHFVTLHQFQWTNYRMAYDF